MRLNGTFPLAGLLMLALAVVPLYAAPGEQDAEPGEVTPGAITAELGIRHHEVSVVLNNGFATTTVDQVLVNPKDTDVSAQWSFPLPKDGSLSELSIDIDGKRVIGEVVEKTRAQEIYEAEKSAGESSALAEQNEFYDYRVSLSRVPARGEVRARIVYYQPLDVESGVGRYLYPLSEGGTEEMNASFWTMEKKTSGRLRFDVTLKTAFPVDGLHCPSHSGFNATQADESTWKGRYEQTGATLDKDFVLFYRLKPDVPARVELLTYRRQGDAEGTYLAVITPGSDLEPIRHGTDWVIVLDVSGSMKGEKIRLLGRGVSKALGGLGPKDRFQVIAFNNAPRRLHRGWIAAGSAEASAMIRQVESLHANGGTNIFDALELACDDVDADRAAAIVLVSDGVANVGPHEYKDFIEQAKRHDVRLFTFVMGNSANERLLGDLATMSGGFAKSVSVQDEVGAHLLLARDRMTHEAMHGVEVEMKGSTVRHPKRLPNLYLGQQLTVFGRYDKTGKSELKIRARISGEKQEWTVPVELPEVDEDNPELERLYALQAMGDMEREHWLEQVDESEGRAALVDMAVRYSLVTDYTSMVVVKDDRKQLYGIGNANAERRKREQAAAKRRAQQGNSVQVQRGNKPLAGSQASHAPSRARRRSTGSGGGGGAIGPLYFLPLAGLVLLKRRKRGNKSS